MIKRQLQSLAAAALTYALAVAPWTSVAAQGDTQPPAVVSRSPGPSVAGISTQVSVRAVFDEPVQASTLSFVLRNAGGTTIPAGVSYDALTQTASLDPSDDLPGASTYTATISGVRDLAGNAIASAVVWSFTTATPTFQESIVFANLSEPTAVEFASDGRVFVAEKSGLIKVFSSLNATTPTVFADLRTKVYNFWDRGLLGMALHPQFPSVPYVYVLYAHDAPIGGIAPVWGSPNTTSDPCPTPPGATGSGCVISARLSRLNATGTLPIKDDQVLLEDWFQQFPSHSIGSLAFGSDGALYASGGDGASFNYVDYGQTGNPGGDPPVPVGGTQTAPTAEGGALRSQDLRSNSPADPVTLDGTIIRIDPDTAAALPDNPLFFNPDPNARRVIAYGLRNPFRFTVRPGTREIWIGDVGWSTWEEINRIVDASDSVVDNFGWPCYEGSPRQPGYEATGLNLCSQLYNEGLGGVTHPFYAYRHAQKVSTEACGTGSSSISGLAFYEGASNYPSSYGGALFFADYSRRCIWVMLADGSGLPDPATRAPLLPAAAAPAQLKIGPGGDLYYVALSGTIRRVRYFPGNQPPLALIQATPTSGAAPLTVSFNASGSSDPENGTLSYAWDLDGDGQFDDASGTQPTWTYASGAHTARLRVSDTQGLFDVAAAVISADESAPVAVISSPGTGTTWKVGDVLTFAGSASDAQDGTLPAARLSWSAVLQHCPASCHPHSIQSFQGVSSGSFTAQDHEYPSYIELTLTATDSAGLQGSKTIQLHPQTVALTFSSSPSALQLIVGASSGTTQFTRTVIVGSSNSISAPSPQGSYQFASWSDGGAQSHNIIAGSTPATYTANFSSAPTTPGLVYGAGFNEGGGTVAGDTSGNSNTGAIWGATWTSTGKFGSALSFDGIDDFVTVPDNQSLDLGGGGTIAAWVKLNAVNRWNGVLSKGSSNTDAVHNYALEIGPDNRAHCVLGNGTAAQTVSGSTQLVTQQFIHLACSWDGSQVRVYNNGALQTSVSQVLAPLANTSPLIIGHYGDVDAMAGVIDEVGIYNVALTAAEIQSVMNTPFGTSSDTTPPIRSDGRPTGTLPAGTTQATLALTSDETATCRYGITAGVTYASMLSTFSTTGGISHSTQVTGLTGGTNYTYYVRCQDSAGNSNTTDFTITFAVASGGDTTPPVRSNGAPTGTLPANTTTTTLSLATNEAAMCRYATTAGTTYASMTNPFSTTGGVNHSTPVTGLSNGTSYTYYVRCQDGAGDTNTNDFAITFAVGTASDTTPPVRSNGAPSGTLPTGTTQATLSLNTNEASTCRYAITAGTGYSAMTTSFTTTGGVAHSTTVTGLRDGTTYNYYVRCQDGAGNSNTSDFTISFSVASGSPAIHVGSLVGTGVKVGGPNWRADVRVSALDRTGAAVSGVVVNAAWTNGYNAAATCTTASNGTCTLSTSNLHKKVASVTLTVSNLSHPMLPYDSASNSSTSVVVLKP